jgi:hypothetical protein
LQVLRHGLQQFSVWLGLPNLCLLYTTPIPRD